MNVSIYEGVRSRTFEDVGIEPKRKESHCRVCGMKYIIERNSPMTTRTDRKRVYPAGETDPGLCSYRCRICECEISEVVPGAEYEKEEKL